jgi:copper chaperone
VKDLNQVTQVTMKVAGMRCGMCEAHICDVIRKQYPKAKAVRASHGSDRASFRIEGEVDQVKLRKAIDETGYRCGSVSVEPYEKKGLFHRR